MKPLSIVPARLEYACGHVGLVSLPLVKGESQRRRSERVEGEKAAARLRSCDFCRPAVVAAPVVEVVAVPNSGTSSLPAVTVDQRETRTMVNNGHAPISQPELATAVSTAGSIPDQLSSVGTKPTLEPAAQQPKRTRSSRAISNPSAEPEGQAAGLEGTTESERPARQRLSVDQQREVARLYAGTTTRTSEIRKRFGISESTLYHIVQHQGVPLRGRSGSSTGTGAQIATAQPHAAVATPPAHSRGGERAPARRAVPSTGRRTASARAASRSQFRIQFRGERVIQAHDIREALRQVESLGAIDVTAVTRED